MPEGDTLFRTAATLHTALAGKQIVAFESALASVQAAARRAGLPGAVVAAVEARGKHLLIRFERSGILRTHLGMHGTWHLYRPGSRWRLPSWKARVVLTTDTALAVCFGAPQVEWIAEGHEADNPSLARLGPDLLAADPDLGEAVRRLRALSGVEIGAALLEQSVMAGVGNVYKSEVLFACRVSPFAVVSGLDEKTLHNLVAASRSLLLRNVQGGIRRTTSHGHPLWVYRRAGRPCQRCGTPIAAVPQGTPPRRTYWCPSCQA